MQPNKHQFRIKTVLMLGFILGMTGFMPVAMAQEPARYPALGQGDTTPGSPNLPRELELTVAAGVAIQPEYQGSDSYEAVFAPALNLEYREQAFLVIDRQSTMTPYEGLGLKLLGNQDVSLGFNMTYDTGRDSSGPISTFGDIDWTALAGVFAAYHPGPWFVRGNVGYDVLGEYDSYKGEVGAGWSSAISPYMRGMIDITGKFAGDNYHDAFFGVSGAQSVASGLAAYDPDGGFYNWGIGGTLQYNLTPGAFVQGILRYDRLVGEAADSPVAEDKGAVSAKAMVGYKF